MVGTDGSLLLRSFWGSPGRNYKDVAPLRGLDYCLLSARRRMLTFSDIPSWCRLLWRTGCDVVPCEPDGRQRDVLTDGTEGRKAESKMLGRTAGSAGASTADVIRRVSVCRLPWRASTASAPPQRCVPGPQRSSSASWSSRSRLFAASHAPRERVEPGFRAAHFVWPMRRRRVGLVLIPVRRFSPGRQGPVGVGR